MDRAGRAALCVMLGAATTWVVAWVFALRVTVPVQGSAYSPAGGMYDDPNTGNQYRCFIKNRPGLTAVVWEPVPPPFLVMSAEQDPEWQLERAPALRRYLNDVTGQAGIRIDVGELPGWARHQVLVSNSDTFCVASARGWPMRALWYQGTIVGGTRILEGGMLTPEFLAAVGPGPVLPFWPIPAGLIADSAFYAGIWYAILVVPGALRRAARRGQGRCAQCGYDLRHGAAAGCPECGALRPAE